MEETQAVSSSASVETPSTFAIPRSGTSEYAEWRASGELPVKTSPKPADPASADPSKETTSEDPADSAATQTQEQRQGKRRPDVEARIKLLTDKTKELETQLAEARRPKETKAEPSPAKPAQTYKDWREKFKPSQWIEQYGKDHPDHSYEDANAAMADYLGDVRDQFRSIEQQRQSQANELNRKVTEARTRYGEKFDEVLQPTLNAIVADAGVNPNVKAMINDSDVIADLIFTLGSDSKSLSDFLSMAKTSPGKALRYIAVVEQGIIDELAKGGKTSSDGGRNDKGQFAKAEAAAPPAKRGPESAPEPPIEIGSRGAGTMDESSRALQSIERGDGKAFRQWKAAEDRKALARRRGA